MSQAIDTRKDNTMSLIDFRGGARTTTSRVSTVQTVARQHLEAAGWDINAASSTLYSYMESHAAHADEVLRMGIRKLLQEIPIADRGAAKRASVGEVWTPRDGWGSAAQTSNRVHTMSAADKRAQERARSMGAVAATALLNQRYQINGVAKMLRDHIGTDIVTLGQSNMQSGMTMVSNAKFLIAVGTAAGAKRVGDVVTEKDAQHLRREASKPN